MIGDNLITHSTALKWYEGPTLIEALDQIELPKRNADGAIRLPIMDKLKD